MGVAGFFKKLDAALEQVASVIHVAGSAVLAVLMIFTAVDVILRYFFNAPIKGDYEISAFMMSIVIPSGLALCAVRKGHINVDVVLMHVPGRIRSALETFAYIVTFGLLCFLTYESGKYAQSLIKSKTAATSIPVPHYPFVIIVTICLAIFALIALRDLIRNIYQLTKGAAVAGDAA